MDSKIEDELTVQKLRFFRDLGIDVDFKRPDKEAKKENETEAEYAFRVVQTDDPAWLPPLPKQKLPPTYKCRGDKLVRIN